MARMVARWAEIHCLVYVLPNQLTAAFSRSHTVMRCLSFLPRHMRYRVDTVGPLKRPPPFSMLKAAAVVSAIALVSLGLQAEAQNEGKLALPVPEECAKSKSSTFKDNAM